VSVPCFLLFLCFRKVTQEIFSELDETKAKVPIFPDTRWSPKQRRRGARGQPHHGAVWPTPDPRHRVVGPPGPPPDAALPPIYSPRWENPKYPINFPKNILQATGIVDARSERSRSSFRHPTGEGNHHRRPSRAHSRAAGSARRSSILDWGPLAGGGASSTAPSDVGFGLTSPAVVLWPATVVVLWRRKKMCFAVRRRNGGGERSSKTIRRCEDVRARSGCLYPADFAVRGQPLFLSIFKEFGYP
jgi:hypothetical protein